ncbi:hypothetical protein F5882DRAFT_422167 [Hyaloscypha sp. PMI_1271]|nr:hypothetical protein F5882DRAFT_422167 [Hyaloscypha sp. PMI_1271]
MAPARTLILRRNQICLYPLQRLVFVFPFICIFPYEYRKDYPPYFPTFVCSLLITTGSLLNAALNVSLYRGLPLISCCIATV